MKKKLLLLSISFLFFISCGSSGSSGSSGSQKTKKTNNCRCDCTDSELKQLQGQYAVSAARACDMCCHFHDIANEANK